MELLTIYPDIQETFPNLYIGLALIQGATIAKRSAALTREKKALLNQFKERFTLRSFLNHPLTAAYGMFYRKIGLDPQITPPGPQNLISRFLEKNQVPTINTLVDACNLAVFSTLIPLGIFDQAKITGSLTLRFSAPHDIIIPIGMSTPHAIHPNVPLFVDDEKVVSAPIYHRDSNFSKIRLTTTEVLLMAIAVEGVSTQELETGLDTGITFITKYNGGHCNYRKFFP